jgi:hypothetical protein
MSPEDWKRWYALAIESAAGCWALFGRGAEMRDAFPLPDTRERRPWARFWKDDRRAWDKSINAVLPRRWNRITSRKELRERITECMDSLAAFFSNPEPEFCDRYFQSLEVRFLIRVFLPCMALHLSRPSTLFAQCIERKDLALLESLVRIDPTLVHLPELAPMLYPSKAAAQAEVWQLIGPRLASDSPLMEKRKVSYHLIALIRWVAAAVHRSAKLPVLIAALPDGDLPIDQGTTQKAVKRILNRAPLPV